MVGSVKRIMTFRLMQIRLFPEQFSSCQIFKRILHRVVICSTVATHAAAIADYDSCHWQHIASQW